MLGVVLIALFIVGYKDVARISKKPVIGALLNCIAFGLADLYVGHFATAIFKLLLNALLWFSAIALVNYLSQFVPYRTLTLLVSCVYFAFAIITGYRTVMMSRTELTPSN